jgi:hypothetical protein
MRCPTALAYVREAKRLRAVATTITTPAARKALLDRAADYRVLAEVASCRRTGGP